MKKLRKILFLAVTAFMVFGLVASNQIHHAQLATNHQQFPECIIAGSTSCDHFYPAPIQPNLTIPQTEPERFLLAIAKNLTIIPQPGTYEYILLRAYGAAFVDQDPAVKFPTTVLLKNEQETQGFQATLIMDKVNNTNNCYLQKSAATALNKARSLENIPLKSGYGASDCTRNFATNLRFWQKYANRYTLDKVRQGKETAILGVVAPPGASQHLWGLAIDLRVSNSQQRQALYENGWFQTVENDLPHWTYLGVSAANLPNLGLKNKIVRGITYWVTPI